MKASQFIKQALKWENKNEADGSFKEIIDLYNSQKSLPRGYKVKYTDEWCATFVSAVAIKLGCEDILPIECGCQHMINKFKEMGCWQENENIVPKVGWLIFYDWQDDGKGDNKGWADHVGIVVKVNNNNIIVLEGNYKKSVTRRIIKVNAKYIRGYGMPKYQEEELDKEKYFTKYKGNSLSIVDALKDIGEISTFMYRGKIAIANGIGSYKGSSEQNAKMLILLKEGKLIKP